MAPDSQIEAALHEGSCAQALAAHAALLVLLPVGSEATPVRHWALDCGVALYRDAHALVIAPR